MCRLSHILADSKDLDTPCAILSLDAEKTFDWLKWQHLWRVLEQFGFGFIKMIQIMYINPSTNGLHSKPIQILNGTRQRCPLSAMLFTLSLAPLAQKIRQNTTTSPIQINESKCKISYAEDILLYISDPEKSIPNVLDLFYEFSDLSWYKINWGKLCNLMHSQPFPIYQSNVLDIKSKILVLIIVKNNYEKLQKYWNRRKEMVSIPASLLPRIAIWNWNFWVFYLHE